MDVWHIPSKLILQKSLYTTSYPTHHRRSIITLSKNVVSTVASIRNVCPYFRRDVLCIKLMQVKQPIRCSSGMELLTNRIITDTFYTVRLSRVPSLLRQNPADSAFSYVFLTSPSTMSASVEIISFWISLDVYFALFGIPLAMLLASHPSLMYTP